MPEEYLYTAEEESRLLNIILEIEENPFFGEHFPLDIGEKLADRFRKLRFFKDYALAELRDKCFKHEHLKVNYRGDDNPTFLAEILLIAGQQGYKHKLADSAEFLKQITSEQGWLDYLLQRDKGSEMFEHIAEEQEDSFLARNAREVAGRLRRPLEPIPVAELNKQEKTAYMAYDKKTGCTILVKKGMPGFCEFLTVRFFYVETFPEAEGVIREYLD